MLKSSVLPLVASLAFAASATFSTAFAAEVKNVVIVHGAFADGSGWRAVSDILTKDGYKVTLVQQPLTSLDEDIAATKRLLDLQDGPSILVGHSYGGMVITGAGSAANVASLVYVAAFQPDKGESLIDLAGSKPVENAKKDTIKATPDGFLYLDPALVPEAFAADLPLAEAEFIARSQVFASQKAFTAKSGEPAWKTKSSIAIIAKSDRSINPDLEREMAKRAGSKVYEIEASHVPYASKPQDVAKIIEEAAKSGSK